MSDLRIGTCILVMAVAGACTDTATDQSVTSATSPSVLAPRVLVVAPQPSSVLAEPPADAQAKFHAKNCADWAGKAHNKALDDFFAQISSKGAPKDLCAEVVEFMSQPARIPTGKAQGSYKQQRAYAIRGLAVTQVCRDHIANEEIGGTGSSLVWLARARPSALSAASVAGVSAAANALLDQISVAQAAATTSSGLASVLTGVLSQADLLVSSERDLVYATASVAQSSFDYWLANMAPKAQQVAVTYSACLGGYAVESSALSGCMGITGRPILPTNYRSPADRPSLLFVAATTSPCDGYLDRGAIGGYDFAGAVVGGAAGLLAGGLGAIPGAVTGGGAASATESWYQFGRWAYCKVRGGTGPVTHPETT